MARITVRLSLLCLFFMLNIAVAAGPPTYKGVDVYGLPAGAVIGNGYGYSFLAPGGQLAGYINGGGYQAQTWNAPNGASLDLSPTNIGPYLQTFVGGTDGANQVGYGYTTGLSQHAILWHGGANTAVDLQPTSLNLLPNSVAVGVHGSQQVGFGSLASSSSPAPTHALLWNGTPQSALDLHPTQLSGIGASSNAVATDGSQQVGWIIRTVPAGDQTHAVVWSGTPGSVVDLQPSGFGDSYALAVGGGQQVGFSYDGGGTALLWTGTPESVVNLNPTNLPGITSAQAFGTNGVHQVGAGYGAGHALLWSGTADSAVDLHQFLPPGFFTSQAYTIDAAGTVWGIAYKETGAGDPHVVKWTPVPEPSTALLGAIGLGTVLLRLGRRTAR